MLLLMIYRQNCIYVIFHVCCVFVMWTRRAQICAKNCATHVWLLSSVCSNMQYQVAWYSEWFPKKICICLVSSHCESSDASVSVCAMWRFSEMSHFCGFSPVWAFSWRLQVEMCHWTFRNVCNYKVLNPNSTQSIYRTVLINFIAW